MPAISTIVVIHPIASSNAEDLNDGGAPGRTDEDLGTADG